MASAVKLMFKETIKTLDKYAEYVNNKDIRIIVCRRINLTLNN